MKKHKKRPDYAIAWDKKNPRLKWAGLSNDERVVVRLAWQNKAGK